MRRRRWRWPRLFLRRHSGRGKFLPERQIRWLHSGIRLSQGLELSLQLPEGKRKIELRSNKKGLNKKNSAEKEQDPCTEQGKAKAGPAFASRIGKNKRHNRVRRVFFHFANEYHSPHKKIRKPVLLTSPTTSHPVLARAPAIIPLTARWI